MANRVPHYLIVGIIILELLGPKAAAQDVEGPDPSAVRINRFAHGGDGCPQGTLSALLSSDAQSITVMFDEFYVEDTSNGRPSEQVKDCLVMMGLTAPAGWAYSLVSLQLRGYAKLEKGAKAMQSVRYRFGTPKMIEISRFNLAGEFDDNYQQAYDLPIQNLNWSECKSTNNPLFINTRIAVSTRNRASGFMTVDSLDGQVEQEYGVLWRPCSGPKVSAAVCRAQFVPAGGKNARQVIAHARAATAQEALAQAQDRALTKCNARGRGAGRCKIPAQNACQIVNI